MRFSLPALLKSSSHPRYAPYISGCLRWSIAQIHNPHSKLGESFLKTFYTCHRGLSDIMKEVEAEPSLVTYPPIDILQWIRAFHHEFALSVEERSRLKLMEYSLILSA